jgi:hypothetical protein
MGKNTLANIDLSEIKVSRDPHKTVQWNGASIFKSIGEISVHWRQKMSYTGNYRIEVNFTSSDVVHLFRAWNGKELDVDLIDNHGFTISPQLKKRILSEIKLADLTIGDLAGLGASPTKEQPKAEEGAPAAVRQLFRRI